MDSIYEYRTRAKSARTRLSGWGQYPLIASELITPLTITDLESHLRQGSSFTGIARAMGRSYGDSSLAPQTINTLYLNHLLDFDNISGTLRCHAGTTLADILKIFVPKGWFLPVTPGTKFITVGGAIASDVHGKNHHCEGSFTDHLKGLRIMLANGDIVTASRQENSDLFHATCGGMGLTGIILDATVSLKSITTSYIDGITVRAANLKHAMELLEAHNDFTYSVAWIDCLQGGDDLGRSVVIAGNHSQEGELTISDSKPLSLPFNMPTFFINPYTMKAFNTFYYNRSSSSCSSKAIHYESFFYPLDRVHHWNRLYGSTGFTQYQFVIPQATGFEAIHEILSHIRSTPYRPFLGVLKHFGEANDNYLSFPMKGYTLALDFKLREGLFKMLDTLDSIILSCGGRLYLSKDVRMSEKTFKSSYPQWDQFAQVRAKYGADGAFSSLQSQRLGL